MNALDALIGYFSPIHGLRRERARLILDAVRSYDGAKKGRQSGRWWTSGASANAEIGPAAPRLRNNARDLERNEPLAKHALRVWVGTAIGTGIVPTPNTGSDRTDRKIGDIFEEWAEQSDANGLLDFYGQQAQAAAGAFLSGEIITRFRPRRPSDGLSIPLQLQVLESDFIDSSKDGTINPTTMQGIQYDPIGRRTGYWLFDQHPGETFNFSLQSRLVPAGDILHVFDPIWRPGQMRGVTELAASMMLFRDRGDYRAAEIMRKKIESCVAAFVTQNDGGGAPLGGVVPATGGVGQKDARQLESFEPGMITHLSEGQDVKFNNPSAVGGYGEYLRATDHETAAGVGLTYEHLTGDLSQVNYSSIKAGENVERRLVEMWQWLVFIPQFCKPVYRRVIDAAVITGKLDKPNYRADWTPPRFQSVDREKDAKADALEMENGTTSLFEAIAAQGRNPRRHIEDLAKILKLLKKYDITIAPLNGPKAQATAKADASQESDEKENDNA